MHCSPHGEQWFGRSRVKVWRGAEETDSVQGSAHRGAAGADWNPTQEQAVEETLHSDSGGTWAWLSC